MAHPNSKRARAAKAKRREARSASSASDPATQARRVERDRRRVQAQAQRQRQATIVRLRTYAAAGGLAALVLVGGWLAFRPGSEIEGVERPANRGAGHISDAAYADSAPTSGAHASQAPRCGVYPTPLPLELAVHGLEHGTVVLWYDQSDPNLGVELVITMARWDSHVIVSPSEDLDAPVVATAWNRRMRFSEVSSEVEEFVDVYRNRGPENIGCPIA